MDAMSAWRNPERLPALSVNPTTRRFPRTLRDAFGAECGSEIEDAEPLGWRVSDIVCIVGTLVLLALLAARLL